MNQNEIKNISNKIKALVVKMTTEGRGGHVGTSLSEVDILTALFFHVMNIFPQDPQNTGRDRFVLSKGHGSEGLYCTLAERGFFPIKSLFSYLSPESMFTSHPTTKVPGVEVCTGALGHGFSISVGMALAAKKSNNNYRTFTIVGDGELQEGSNWEAAMSASHFELGNLTVIVDNNGLQLADKLEKTMKTEPIDKKFESFGFDVHHAEGNSVEDLIRVFDLLDYTGKKPHAIIAHTTKGSGVSFMEGIAEWHHRVPTQEEANIAYKELEEANV